MLWNKQTESFGPSWEVHIDGRIHAFLTERAAVAYWRGMNRGRKTRDHEGMVTGPSGMVEWDADILLEGEAMLEIAVQAMESEVGVKKAA